MNARLLITGLVVCSLAFGVSEARAADWTHPSFDAISTEVAGKPIHAYCSDNQYEWDITLQAWGANGFTNFSRPVTYISPKQCEMLHFGLTYGYAETGIIPLTSAVFTLLHEAVHQRGGVYANCTTTDLSCEGRTDCAAMPLVVPYLERFFGLIRTSYVSTQETYTYTQSVRRKIAGKWRTIRIPVTSQRVVQTQITNPAYVRAGGWVGAWHRSKAAQYQGGC
jgi:hypothetical protein